MNFVWLCSIIFCLLDKICVSQDIDFENIKIWGPGLNPDIIVMPARYFFIDAGFNRSPSSFIFDVQVYGTNKYNTRCRIWQNVLDRKDGTFIIRYKLYETCDNFRIEVLYKDKHVGNSPYVIQNSVYSDDCNCPEQSLTKWIENFKCDNFYEQMENDLSVFSSINFTDIRTNILLTYNKPTSYSICNYVIKNNEIYRKCYGKYVGFNMFMDSILLSLARKVRIPDLEFFVNLGDWPLSLKTQEPLPIFSWCGSDDSYDIVMPTYDVTESTLENMGRVMLDMLSVQGNIGKNWSEKIPQVFWRGRDSNRRRLQLVDIAREHPDLFNISLTNFFFFQSEAEKYGPKVDHVSFFSFFDYKYQFNIDGTVAAYRFPYLLAGDSLIFKQDSKYYEWFYHLLKPGQHFIQINEDLSNVIERVRWAIDHDEEAKRIAMEGQSFARHHLLPQNIFCYYAVLLSKWRDHIVSEVVVLDGMEHIPQPSSTCECVTNIKDEL